MKQTVTAVTGSASGIGAAVSQLLKENGHRVIGIDRVNADINADLSTSEGRQAVITQLSDLCQGKLDGLICCAGVGVTAPSNGLIISVNYFGVTELLEGLEGCLSQSEQPAVTIIGSFAAIQQLGEPDAMLELMLEGKEEEAINRANELDQPQISYAASKYAVSVYARKKAVAWGKQGIRLNVIAPGAVETPLHKASEQDPRFGQAVKDFVAPIGRAGKPSEIAELAAFLQSGKASFIHGSVFFIDGGMDAMVRTRYF